ncbi:hypothetical protein Cal7507_3270 [Calothrix sp. PCC 7507]|nr:hypothetical protein Cal7507_3270 [Calothrix sp. PCC 7507]
MSDRFDINHETKTMVKAKALIRAIATHDAFAPEQYYIQGIETAGVAASRDESQKFHL